MVEHDGRVRKVLGDLRELRQLVVQDSGVERETARPELAQRGTERGTLEEIGRRLVREKPKDVRIGMRKRDLAHAAESIGGNRERGIERRRDP